MPLILGILGLVLLWGLLVAIGKFLTYALPVALVFGFFFFLYQHFNKRSETMDTVIDLRSNTIGELYNQLQRHINKPPSPFLFIQERDNRRIRLDLEKTRLLADMVDEMRRLNASLNNLKADLILNDFMLNAIVANKRLEAQRQAILLAEQHANRMHALRAERRAADLLLEGAEISNLYKRAEINLLNAQVRMLEAKTERERADTKEAYARADFMKYILENINVNALPEGVQGDIVQSIFNPNGHIYANHALFDQLRPYISDQMKSELKAAMKIAEAKALHAGAEADQKLDDVEHRKWKNLQDRLPID